MGGSIRLNSVKMMPDDISGGLSKSSTWTETGCSQWRPTSELGLLLVLAFAVFVKPKKRDMAKHVASDQLLPD